MSNVQFATVTDINGNKIKVKFSQDDTASELEYLKLDSYVPEINDRVLMLKTNTSYICLGAIK